MSCIGYWDHMTRKQVTEIGRDTEGDVTGCYEWDRRLRVITSIQFYIKENYKDNLGYMIQFILLVKDTTVWFSPV